MSGKSKYTLEERFWSKIDKRGPNDCWEWTGCLSDKKYRRAQIWANGRFEKVHRMAWILTNGPIPDGLGVLHTCDNGLCCNPAHLFLGTQLDNMRDMFSKGRHPIHRGEDDPKSKLTEEQVRFIRSHYIPFDSELGQAALGRRFGVHRTTIEGVLRGDNWKHVK